MQLRKRNIFITIRAEGSILPADLLQRINNRDAHLKGLTPDDYHLAGGLKLNEAINQSWNRMQGAWAVFQSALEKLPPSDTGTTVTREKWLLPLFQELGYGRLPAAKSIEIEGKSYPISHLCQQTPIHLVSARVDLDTRTAGVAGASRVSPHGLTQELLNRAETHLWGFVSNGLRLRILRKNVSLTRQSYVEFDLEAMMNGEQFPDFMMLWLLCHESRVNAERPQNCWLESWSKAAHEQGTRALEQLRNGVEEAIKALGRGFLAHPANQTLLGRLRNGELDKQDYYRQLLRLVYRLLFLFVAEDRELLFSPEADEKKCERYTRFYSVSRLRRLAERRLGARHGDLYHGLGLVMQKLGNGGCAELGLPALGSFLFSDEATADLNGCELANHELLEAVRALAFITDGHRRRTVDYKNLRSEELGSVYEALLELHPEINAEARQFNLASASGNERKTTGSYYTPVSLVQCLLNSALDPVLTEASKQPDAEQAILRLKVVDPACGSGHFLIAAAHRMAKRLATVRTGDDEPAPEAVRTALRDVIGRCIYGVDINPMAVELCKVSLWMEALEPGKPLSFLEHRIQYGNALIGATPSLIAKGIPDEAFETIEGDDPTICAEYKRINKNERLKQQDIFVHSRDTFTKLGDLATSVLELDAIDDSSIEGIQHKQRRYEDLVHSSGYLYGQFLADVWCAAFVWRKTREFPFPITEEVFRKIEQNPFHYANGHNGGWLEREVKHLRQQYGFFHWHLAFPEVFSVSVGDEDSENLQAGWSGGFDVILGNPPWDTMSPDAKEFFSVYDEQIRFQDSQGQKTIIADLLADRAISENWNVYRRKLFSQVHFFKRSERYSLYAPGNLGKGDFNVFRMFVETALQNIRQKGRASQLVPEGLYNGANCMAIRKCLFDNFTLDHILGFENSKENWFKGIDSRTKFCLYAAQKGGETGAFRAFFNIRTQEQLGIVMAGGTMNIPVAMVQEFSPEALAIMEFNSQLDINIATKMYAKYPKFGDSSAGPPYRHYMREIDMGTDRELFDEDSSGLPLYEGRMVDQFDHRAKGYRSGRGRSSVWEVLSFSNASKSIQPQWYIPQNKTPGKLGDRTLQYRIGFCDVASPTNERTLVSTLIPPKCICGDKVPTITFERGFEWSYMIWLAVANSFAMDFLVRKKVSLKMSYTILDSLPFPRLPINDVRVSKLMPLVLSLICTGREMVDYHNSIATLGGLPPVPSDGNAPGLLDEQRRFEVRCEIEAIVAREIFDLSREEISYIMESFGDEAHGFKGNEIRQYGEYRTKRAILEIYDAMQQTSMTGQPYQTRLDPLPASGWTPTELAVEEMFTKSAPQSPETPDEKQADLFKWQSKDPQQQLKFDDLE